MSVILAEKKSVTLSCVKALGVFSGNHTYENPKNKKWDCQDLPILSNEITYLSIHRTKDLADTIEWKI